MVKIIEIHHELDNKDNFQSRVVEADSFEVYKNQLLEDGNNKFPYASIPRQCEIENFKSGRKWLECEFARPSDSKTMKHIAYELTLNDDYIIRMRNNSEINILKSRS